MVHLVLLHFILHDSLFARVLLRASLLLNMDISICWRWFSFLPGTWAAYAGNSMSGDGVVLLAKAHDCRTSDGLGPSIYFYATGKPRQRRALAQNFSGVRLTVSTNKLLRLTYPSYSACLPIHRHDASAPAATVTFPGYAGGFLVNFCCKLCCTTMDLPYYQHLLCHSKRTGRDYNTGNLVKPPSNCEHTPAIYAF